LLIHIFLNVFKTCCAINQLHIPVDLLLNI
jgi:hypothetical protein